MNGYITRPIVWIGIFLLLLVSPVVVMMIVPGLRPADMMATHMGEQLELVPDRFVASHTLQIAKLDLAGTDVLVRALGNSRAIVADSAGSALHAQLDAWAQLPSRESSPRVALLARLLSEHASQWTDASRDVAADLATRILHWPVHSEATNKADLIAHCERVLRMSSVTMVVASVPPAGSLASSVSGVSPRTTERDADHTPDAAAHMTRSTSRASSNSADPRDILQLPLAGVSGGELPIKEVELPPLPPSLASPLGLRPVREGEPRLLTPERTQLPRVIFPDERPSPDPNAVPFRPAVPHRLAPGIEHDPNASKMAPASATEKHTEKHTEQPDGRLAEGHAKRHVELERLADLELIHLLHGSTGTELEEVETQLRRRGFDDAQLRRARRIADPDPTVRRQLAESLADMRGSPSPWLFWLSYDPDPSVRQLVVSLMATTQDPRLHRRLREMQRLETDAAVRAQLARLFDKGRTSSVR